MIDTKSDNEIALNLAKLKEDLKSQAEAISDLRKQAWENTGSTYMSHNVKLDSGVTNKAATPNMATEATTFFTQTYSQVNQAKSDFMT